jgi:exodeoxyribonuclease V alpha subunit
MTTHLSTRLVWHDRAWDGHICDHPSKNAYEYEQKLQSKGDPNDFRLPDFTVSYEGDTFYWEHLGMLSVPSYKEAWERKRQWYEDNGFLDRVITSEDGLDGSIDAAAIDRIARKKILLED